MFTKNLSIGKERVPYYGCSALTQYIRGKTIKFDMKTWVMPSSDDFPFDFQVYTGKEAYLIILNWSWKGLSSVLLNKLTIQMSTSFTQITTLADLLPLTEEKGIRHTGTVRQNQIEKCSVTCSKEFKTEESGEH